MSTTTSKTRPAIVGGAVMGVLSALPIISAGNICCCLWVICGGVVAAYVLQQDSPEPITAGDGAVVGLFAGLIGAVLAVVISIPFTLLMAPLQRQFFDAMRERGQFPPEFEDYMMSTAVGVLGTILWGCAMLVAGAIFSTLGGLLGAAIFRKPPQPVAPPPPQAMAPPPQPPQL